VRLRKRKRLRHMTSITIARDPAAIPQQIRYAAVCAVSYGENPVPQLERV